MKGKCAGGVEFDMENPCPECGATRGQACGRVMAEERAIVREICAAGREVLEIFTARPDMLALVGPKERLAIDKLAAGLTKAQPKPL